MSATEPDQTACMACGASRVGRYCHACGQDSRAKSRPLRDLMMDSISEATSLDGKMARTVHALALKPGRLLEAYRAGADSRYVTPPKLFLVSTALFLAVLGLSSVTLFQYTWKVLPGQTPVVTFVGSDHELKVSGAREEDRWLQRHVDPAIDPEIERALERAAAGAGKAEERAAAKYEIAANQEQLRLGDRLSDWLGNVLWVLLPLYALLLVPLFGRRRLLIEHLVFAMWAHAIAFTLMIALAGVNALGADLPAWLLVPPYLAYVSVAASRYYGVGRWSALWRGAVHLIAYLLLVVLPAAILIYLSIVDWAAFAEWLRAG